MRIVGEKVAASASEDFCCYCLMIAAAVVVADLTMVMLQYVAR